MKKNSLITCLNHVDTLNLTTCLLMMALLLPSARAYAQAELIRDVNTSENQVYHEYANLLPANDKLFFTSQRQELWNTDGTTAGTIRFKTLTSISDLVWEGSTLYFVGGTDGGRELCKSTGPGAATGRIKNIRPGPDGSDPAYLTNVNGVLFFVANDGVHGAELWKSDGTANGTVMVKDIFPGAEGSGPSHLVNMNGVLYFSADDSQHGSELWKSNGTPAGTMMVNDICPGEIGSDPDWLNAMNGKIYFTAYRPESGRELWRSNGTVTGTVQIKDFVSGPGSPIRIAEIVTMENALYFIVDDVLWRSSGTTYGTSLLKDLSPGNPYVFEVDYHLTPINGKLYFAANDQIWISDGKPGGTNSIPMRIAANPHFTLYKESIYFFDYYFNDETYVGYYRLKRMNIDGTGETEVWRTPIYPGWENEEDNPFRPELVKAGNTLFFYGIPGEGLGHKLMKSDGTEEGTMIVKDTYVPTNPSNPDGFVSLNGVLYFKSPSQIENSRFVYRTDGTKAGTFLLKELELKGNLVPIGDNLYFNGYSDLGSWQLWKTNGTKSGTTLIKSDSSTWWSDPVDFNGTILFFNRIGELWRSDGTPNGTVLVRKLDNIEHILYAVNRVYVFNRVPSGDLDLWKSNGTAEGTIRLETLRPATGLSPRFYSFPNSTINGITYFFGTDSNKGYEVWRTNGTTSGTYRIKVVRIPGASGGVQWVRSSIIYQNSLYYSAPDENNEFALYRSNGTSYSTSRIASLRPISEFIPLGENLLFLSVGNLNNPPELWRTNGTTTGTNPVMALDDQSRLDDVDYQVIDDVAYFLFRSFSLWRTDGTECGTFPLSTGLSQVTRLGLINDLLILGGYADYLYGHELYRYNLSGAPSSPCAAEIAIASIDKPAGQMVAGSETEPVKWAPNPFDTDFSISINGTDQSEAQLHVYDINGRLVESIVLECNTTHQLGQKWPSGFYLLSIRIGNLTTSRKVIKR